MNNFIEIDEAANSSVEALIITPQGPWFLQFALADEPGKVRLGMQSKHGRAAMNLSPDELESFAQELLKLANEVRK